MLHRRKLKDGVFFILRSYCIVDAQGSFRRGELNLMSLADSTSVLPCWTVFWAKVGGVGVPRLGPDLESTSVVISGCGIEAEPPNKPAFWTMTRKKIPFSFLAAYPRDLNALPSSKDTLGQNIVSDSWTWWHRPPDFSGSGGVQRFCM